MSYFTERRSGRLITGLDIGAGKVCAVTSMANDKGLEILGIGVSSPSDGIKNGVVISINDVVRSIRKAVADAESMAGCKLNTAYVSIGGEYIEGCCSRGTVLLKGGVVSGGDIERAIESAKAMAAPLPERDVIQIVRQGFTLDGVGGVMEPMELAGERLEAEVYLVTAASTVLRDIVRSANRAGLEVSGVVLKQLASGEAVLEEAEKDLGVVLVDIGSATTEVVVYTKGMIGYTGTIPFGGDTINRSIFNSFNVSLAVAENVKRRYGCVTPQAPGEDEELKVRGIGGRGVRLLSRRRVEEVIEAGVKEVFALIKRSLSESLVRDRINAGVVLTGGSANMSNLEGVAESVFDCPVRIGLLGVVKAATTEIRDPMYATGVGLVLCGEKEGRGSLKGDYSTDRIRSWVGDKMGWWFRRLIYEYDLGVSL